MSYTYTDKRTSGKDGIGLIPKHWDVSVLKRVLSEPLKYGATEAGDCDDRSLPRYLRITDFDGNGTLRADTFASLPEDIARDYYVNEGDVLFARSGATVGKTFLFRNHQGRACFAGYLIKASPARHKLTSEFLYYFTKSAAYEAWKDNIFTQATIQNIGADKYAYLPICLPPLPEQRRISTYLDASCAVIDTAVSTKRRQLITLDALRRTIINHAVTQGVHDNRKTKVTDIDWFPTIPTEWKVVRFKNIFNEIYRYPTYYNIDYVDEGIPEVRGEALTAEGFIRKLDDERYISPETSALFPRTQLMLDDIVMSVRGTMGKIGLVDEQYVGANITANLLRLSPNQMWVSGAYLRWLMRSAYFNEALNSSAPQTTIKTITMPYLLNIRVPVPPKREQVEIQSFLTEKMAEIDSIEVPLTQQITTLTAYRKSLIHECVTGQRRITEADLNRVKRYG